MVITIHPATEADAPTLARIESRAFNPPDQPGDSVGRLLFGPPSAEGQAARAVDMVDKLQTFPEIKIFKAVVEDENENESDGQKTTVVAFAQWRFYTDPMPQEEWTDREWEHARNAAACNEFFGEMTRKRMRIMGGKTFACMIPFLFGPEKNENFFY
jgi:hypothetical protein